MMPIESHHRRGSLAPLALVPLCLGAAAPGGGDDDELRTRVEQLEKKNAELTHQVNVLADEQERLELGDLVPPLGEGVHGLGPAASKVYAKGQGISIGGYGEMVFTDRQGGPQGDVLDFLRSVLYFGYKFDDHWVFNSEIEFEHATTDGGGGVSVEFAYVDYLFEEAVNARAGLLLVPMGFINELHEPSTYLAVSRPETERRILPSTWRENGVGIFGDVGPVTYRAYAVNGFDALGFDGGGLRGGRQKGSKARAEDFAFVGRADWTATPGVLAGVSVYRGDAGQNQPGLGATTTTIVEAHAEIRADGLWARGLAAQAFVDDVAELNAATGENVGERHEGFYVEAGYDVLAAFETDGTMSLSPFVRFESIDTQASTASGFSALAANDEEILTFGINFRPLDSIVIKVDFQDYERGVDRINATIGYAF